MSPADPTLIAGLLAGLAGSGHCLGMCGGISAALGGAAAPGGRGTACVLGYNLGRVGSYALIGGIAGLLGAGIGQGLGAAAPALRLLAAALMILVGLQIVTGWRLLAPPENAGLRLWQHIAPLARRCMPVRQPGMALLLGALWGWLPCGLVYAMALTAAGMGGAAAGAGFMLAFGLGTLPAMALVGATGSRLTRSLGHAGLRRAAGLAVVVLGAWTAVLPLQALSGAGH